MWIFECGFSSHRKQSEPIWNPVGAELEPVGIELGCSNSELEHSNSELGVPTSGAKVEWEIRDGIAALAEHF